MPFVIDEMKEAAKGTGPSNAVFTHNTRWNEGRMAKVPATRVNKKLVYNLNFIRKRG